MSETSVPANGEMTSIPPATAGRTEDADWSRVVRPHIRERITEDVRQSDSMRGIILETINLLYREYGVRGLRHFRLRVEEMETTDELKVASDMLVTIGRFHEICSQDERERQ
jgi:hypothetical protein